MVKSIADQSAEVPATGADRIYCVAGGCIAGGKLS
jgi:hypothetical protein